MPYMPKSASPVYVPKSAVPAYKPRSAVPVVETPQDLGVTYPQVTTLEQAQKAAAQWQGAVALPELAGTFDVQPTVETPQPVQIKAETAPESTVTATGAVPEQKPLTTWRQEIHNALERGGLRTLASGPGTLGAITTPTQPTVQEKQRRALGVPGTLGSYAEKPTVGEETRNFSDRMKVAAATIYDDSLRPEVQPQKKGALGYIANTTFETLPLMALSTAVAVPTGGAGAFATAAMAEGEAAYQEARRKGAAEDQAQLERLIVGTINGVIERSQADEILSLGKGVGKDALRQLAESARQKAWGKLAKQAGQIELKHVGKAVNEGLEEAAQEAVQIGAATIHGDKIELGPAAQRVAQAGLGGLTAGYGLTGAAGVAQAVTDAATTERRTAPAPQVKRPYMPQSAVPVEQAAPPTRETVALSIGPKGELIETPLPGAEQPVPPASEPAPSKEAPVTTPKAAVRTSGGGKQAWEGTVYRGTSAEGPADEGQYGKGTYYSTSPEEATTYGGRNVQSAQVRLSNPYVVAWEDAADIDIKRIIKNHGKHAPEEAQRISQQIRERLEGQGYDGIVIQSPGGGPSEVVVFSPEKSVAQGGPSGRQAVVPSVAEAPAAGQEGVQAGGQQTPEVTDEQRRQYAQDNEISLEEVTDEMVRADLAQPAKSATIPPVTAKEGAGATPESPSPKAPGGQLQQRFDRARSALAKADPTYANPAFWEAFGEPTEARVAKLEQMLSAYQKQPAQKPAKAKPGNSIDALLDRYDSGDIQTIQDLADDAEALAEEADNQALREAVQRFREEQRQDRELAGRGDMDKAEADLIAAMKAAKSFESSPRSQGAGTPPTGKESLQVPPVVEATAPAAAESVPEIALTTDGTPSTTAQWNEVNTEIEVAELRERPEWKKALQDKPELASKNLHRAAEKMADDNRPGHKANLSQWVSALAREVPEFADDPVFTVAPDKMLVFQDGGRYKIHPRWFGLKAENLTVGQKIRLDRESFGIKEPSAKALAKEAKTGIHAPKLSESSPGLGPYKPPTQSQPAPTAATSTGPESEAGKTLSDAIASKDFDALKSLLSAEEGHEANREQFTRETGVTLPDSVAGTENTIGEWVAGRVTGKLPGGRQAGGTTLIPDMAAEVLGLAKDFAENPVRLVALTWDMVKRNLASATTYMRTLGAPGRLLARDLDDITFRVTKLANTDRADIREVFKGMSKEQRELIAKVMNERVSAKGQPKDILDRVVKLRAILDRSMREAAGLGMTRKLATSEHIPVGGKGKAYPQIPNSKGMRFLEEAATKGKSSKRVFVWAQAQAKEGKFKTVDDAITALQKFRDTQLRGINRYLETARVELPVDMIEWDGAKTLSVVVERNWMTVEGVRRWGLDTGRHSFPRANTRIESIRTRFGADHAQRVKNFIQTSFGLQSPASRWAQSASNIIRGFQFVTKVGLSPLTIIRNMTDRLAKGMMASPLSTIRATVEYPPFLNSLLPSARRFEDRMIRNGVVFGHGALSEGYEAGSFFSELLTTPFSESERGNQAFIALVHYHKLMNDLSILKADRTRLANAVNAVFGHSQAQAAERVGPRLMKKIKTGEDITEQDIYRFLHEMVSRRAFPMLLNSKPIWYDAHPLIKTLAQFKTWPMRQAKMLWDDVFKYTVKTGDFTRLFGFVLGTLIAGEIYAMTRDLLFGSDKSLAAQVAKGPDQREVAKAIQSDLINGGLLGFLTDLSYGVYDWAAGVSITTSRNLVELAAHIKKAGIEMAPAALEQFIEKEVTPYRQIKAALGKLDQVQDKENLSEPYIQWRAKSWDWLHRHQNPTLLARIDAYTDDVIFGKPKYEIGDSTLAYRMAARQIVAGDIEDATGFLEHIVSKAKPEEVAKTIAGIKASMQHNSPLGPIPIKERKVFLKALTPEEQDAAKAAQKEFEDNYEKALAAARPYQNMSDADLRKFKRDNTYQTYSRPSAATGWVPHLPGQARKESRDLVNQINAELRRRQETTK
ncbi:MAG: hypothetical protein LLG01_00905 [Planctomycetaceae bacterium]|nr:hypothetical protein [Planctomycetaceae bacterium]